MKLSVESQMIKGHMQLLILAAIYHHGASHGYRIRQVLIDLSNRTAQPSFGQLYPHLKEMERIGWLTSRIEKVGERRERKAYTLTASGRDELKRRIYVWNSFSSGVARILHDIRL
jgi:DNA-binding PadR family transcriptional regulator